MKAHFLDKKLHQPSTTFNVISYYIQSIVDLIWVRSDLLDQLFGDLDLILDHFSNNLFLKDSFFCYPFSSYNFDKFDVSPDYLKSNWSIGKKATFDRYILESFGHSYFTYTLPNNMIWEKLVHRLTLSMDALLSKLWSSDYI